MINSLRLRARDAQSKVILLLVAGLAIGAHGATDSGEPQLNEEASVRYEVDFIAINCHEPSGDRKITVFFRDDHIALEAQVTATETVTYRSTMMEDWAGPFPCAERAGGPTNKYRFMVKAVGTDLNGSEAKNTLTIMSTVEFATNIMRHLGRPFVPAAAKVRRKQPYAPLRKWLRDDEVASKGVERWTGKEGAKLYSVTLNNEREECNHQFEIDYIPEGTYAKIPGAMFVMRILNKRTQENQFMFPCTDEWEVIGMEHHVMTAFDLREKTYGNWVELRFTSNPATASKMKKLSQNRRRRRRLIQLAVRD